MAARIYVSFNDLHDNARANRVRKCLLRGGHQIAGFWPYSAWSATRGDDQQAGIKQAINRELDECELVLILIGPDTAANPWVRFVIERAHQSGKAMLGVTIHALPDEHGQTAEPDINPFERFAVIEGVRKIRLNERYQIVDWPGGDPEKLQQFIDSALQSTGHHRQSATDSGSRDNKHLITIR